MKAAFAVWNNRIAPVFDAARQLCLVEAEAGQVVREAHEPITDDLPVRRAQKMAECDINTLVCGAISRPLHEMIVAHGIQVIAFVAGDLSEIVEAWIAGNCDWSAYAMPGCCRQGQSRFRGAQGIYQEEIIMNERKRNRMGRVGGSRQSQGSQGAGRMGGLFAAGPTGYCVCPQCGQREIHKRGVPCILMKCSKCGTLMTRYNE